MGAQLSWEGVRVAREAFGADKIYLETQTYALGFHEKQGFRVISEEFLLDGLPHVMMLLEA